ncbi:Afadin and alpha-actinin-binding-domain-containing protein [Nemania sp. FL0916]|nr:Afadin and alpha-actinin-binding-domain-containing protein [Nemania sp. FL0916]
MIDPDNLRTASLYINNQLLSRGLLRDGQTIDFADPEGGDEGGLQAAMGRVIGVVNDLILRRDRDAAHRESLSSTLRTLRADSQRQATDSVRQAEKLDDAQRRLDIAEATERALRNQLKSAEQGIHKLRDEVAKMKTLVTQTRSACATETRKRDRQVDNLKKALQDAGRVRGGARRGDVVSITVTGSDGDEGDGVPAGATADEGYSLRMETNGFLTELARGLSDENEGLLALVQRTVDALREMSGLDRNLVDVQNVEELAHGVHQHHQHQLEQGIHTKLTTTSTNTTTTQPPQQKTAAELAADLEAVVSHLRSILTNPSFVPLDEVVVRDEAIARLRAALETMEARWREAVTMMDGWRRRMVGGGERVGVEDLQMGLRLSPVRVRDVEETRGARKMEMDVEKPVRLDTLQEEDEEEEVEEVEEAEGGKDKGDIGRYAQRGDRDEEQQYQYHKQQESRRSRSKSPVESLRLVPAPRFDAEVELGDDDSDLDSDASSIFQDDDLYLNDLDAEEPNVQILQTSTGTTAADADVDDSMDSSPLPEPPKISPLKDSYSSGNRNRNRNPGTDTAAVRDNKPAYRKRPGDFTTIVEENTRDLAAVTAAVEKDVKDTSAPHPTYHKNSAPVSPQIDEDEEEDALQSYTASYDSPLFGKSGEKPSQAQLSRKLFSKSPAQGAQKKTSSGTGTGMGSVTSTSTGAGNARSQGGRESPPAPAPPPTRTTRSGAKKPVDSQTATRAAKGTGVDSDGYAAASSTSTAMSATTTSLSTASSKSTSSAATSQRKQVSEGVVKGTISANSSSPSSPSADQKHLVRNNNTNNTNQNQNQNQDRNRNRSPARTQQQQPPQPPASSRLPRPQAPHQQQSPLNMATIAAKLAASEREADAARVRAKLKAVRRNRRISGLVGDADADIARIQQTQGRGQAQEQDQEQVKTQAELEPESEPQQEERYATVEEDTDPIKRDPNPNPRPLPSPRRRRRRSSFAADPEDGNDVDELGADEDVYRRKSGVVNPVPEEDDGEESIRVTKRRGAAAGRRTSKVSKASKVASRRRSTLSPWELQGLITGNVGGVESPAR